MDAYNVPIHEAIIRYLAMMALIIVGVFTGWWFLAFLALPLFLTALIGICPVKRFFQKGNKQKQTMTAHHTEQKGSSAKAA